MVVWEVGFEAHCLNSVPRAINVGEGELLSTNLQENNTVLLGGPGMKGASHTQE